LLLPKSRVLPPRNAILRMKLQILDGTTTDKNSRIIHEQRSVKKRMPAEISNVDEFVAMSAKAKSCSVKRLKETVKLKLRTPRMLYTLKIEPLRAEEIIKKLKCEIREL